MCKYTPCGYSKYSTSCESTFDRPANHNKTTKNSCLIDSGWCPSCGESIDFEQLFGIEIEYEFSNNSYAYNVYEDEDDDYNGYWNEEDEWASIGEPRERLEIDDWVVKGDCSLNNGFEATLGCVTYEQLNEKIDKFCSDVKKVGVDCEDHCGLHIHIDVTGVDKAQVNMVQYYISLHKGREVSMWGREDGEYHYAFGYEGDRRSPLPANNKFQRIAYREEFNTLEMRMFKSTDNADVIKSYVEFANDISKLMRTGHVYRQKVDDAMGDLIERNERICNVLSRSM